MIHFHKLFSQKILTKKSTFMSVMSQTLFKVSMKLEAVVGVSSLVINFLRQFQRVKIKKRSRTSFCRHWQVWNVCKISTKKILNPMVVGAHQSFQFFNTWFHENNRPSSKFLYWILHCFISIAKLLKKQSIRPKVILPTRATLTRNNRSQMFFKISVLKNFAIFTGKHLCWSLFK